MKIIIRPKNIKLTEALDDFIQEKIGSLARFINVLKGDEPEKGKPMGEFFVEIEKETRHHNKGPYFKATAWVHLPGKTLEADAESEDLRSAIVEVKDEMQQELKKYKTRKIDLERRGARSIKKKFTISPDARFRRPI